MRTPFYFGGTVYGSTFTNRTSEKERLKNNLLNGISTTLISPRRWGKSSLVEKVAEEIRSKNKDVRVVLIDLFSVSNREEFLELFAYSVIKESSSRWEDWMNSGRLFFRSLVPKLSMGTSPETDFSLSFDWKELKKHGHEVLNLPETIAKKKKTKFIICLDEFQNLAVMRGFHDFEKELRASWQRHKNVTYCLYGSRRHMMSDLFNNPSKPFYRFGDVMMLPKIRRSDWIRYICKNFESTGKKITEKHAGSIAELMKDIPWYVQQLAHYTWQITEKTASEKEIHAALLELIHTNTPFYQKETESLSTTQLNLLKAVAKGENRFTSTSVMQQFRLGTPRNASKNKQILADRDIIHEINGTYEFVDPSFELWFKKQFFQIPL